MTEMNEYTADASPRQREWMRSGAMEGGGKTIYEKVDDCTERVTWTNADGEGFSWTQTWPCSLDDAPQVGDLYRVLHDEWFVPAGGRESASRVIHSYENVSAVSGG